MTQNQIQYATLKETARSNQARETETHRANVTKETEDERSHRAQEAQKAAELFETTRSHKAQEEINKYGIDTAAHTADKDRAARAAVAELDRNSREKTEIYKADKRFEGSKIQVDAQKDLVKAKTAQTNVNTLAGVMDIVGDLNIPVVSTVSEIGAKMLPSAKHEIIFD